MAAEALTAELHIYREYPHKTAKPYALRCIRKAVARLMKGEAGEPPCSEREALVRLYRATKAYAASPQGRQAVKSKIPHPSTWYNQGRYLDEPSVWQAVIGDSHGARSKQTVDAGREFIENYANSLGFIEAGSPQTSPAFEQRRLPGLRGGPDAL